MSERRGKWQRKPLRERFMARVLPEPNSGCWLWDGTLGARGYGFVSTYGEARELAHRVSYRLHCGEIPAGCVVCHRCDVPACVNPGHLFAAPQAENLRDMDRKGRRRPNSAIPPEWIARIKANKHTPSWAIAMWFGISKQTVSNYRTGKTWRNA